MIDVCDAISNAEKCVLALAEKRVQDVTFGSDSDESLYQLLTMEGYIEALDNYKKSLNLACKEFFSCLTDEEICQIIEKINLMCSVCGC